MPDGQWIEPVEFARIQALVPMVCINVLPVRVEAGRVVGVGLILRRTPEGERWCTVGGRLRRNETFAEAITRELLATLGPDIRFELTPDTRPQYVQPYYTRPRATGGHDSRQHSIGLSWAVPISGTVRVGGKAWSFAGFAG